MLNMSFWIILLFAAIPSLLIVTDISILGSIDENLTIYESLDDRILIWLYINWALIGIPLGSLLLKKIFKVHITYKVNPKSSSFLGGGIEYINYSKITIFILTIIFLLLVILNIDQNTPLLAMISGLPSEEVIALRGKLNQISSLLKYINLVLSYDTIQIFSLIAYFFMAQGRKDWNYIFYITFCTVIFYGFINGSTGSLVFYIAPLIYLRYLILGKFFNIYKIFIGILLFLIIYISYKLQSDYDNYELIFKHIFNRILFDQLKGLYFSFIVFPDLNQHLYFSSTAKWLHDIFSWEFSHDYGHILMSIYSPEGYASGYASHFTSLFLTEIWVNFGLPGLIIGPIWIGFFVYFIFCIFSFFQKSVFSNVLYVNMSIVGFGYFSSFQSFYYPMRIAIIYISTYLLLKIGIAFQKK